MNYDKTIPIFFATDDNYIPYLDVAIRSLIDHTSVNNKYDIYVLNTGLSERSKQMVKSQEKQNVSINFCDISLYVEEIKDKFKKIMHFGVACYYRLFIQNLFPHLTKVLYLDCDIVVLRDVADLFDVDLGDNMLAGAVEQFVANTKEYSMYAKYALGLDSQKYINTGILLMDLTKFREHKIEQKFTYMLTNYNFELIDPDQAYINFLCRGKILLLPKCWNKTNYKVDRVGSKHIVHFALAEKPWQSDVDNCEYFWYYAKKSQFYDMIRNVRQNFSDIQREQKKLAELALRQKAIDITNQDNTFYNKIVLGVLKRITQRQKEIYGVM